MGLQEHALRLWNATIRRAVCSVMSVGERWARMMWLGVGCPGRREVASLKRSALKGRQVRAKRNGNCTQ